MSTGEWLELASIPVFTGVIGWLINWSGVLMLFNPVRFHGFTVPGLLELSTLLPRKLQEIPGIMQGGIGWQGIVPARAAKMGSIAVDKAIAKLGTPGEFYQQLEPDKIAEHIVVMFEPEIPRMVDDVMQREHAQLWSNVPPRAKQAVYQRVQQQLPGIVRQITDEIGIYIDQLLDPKIMVIDQFQKHPALVNKIFRDFGKKELDLMVNFGFIFGFLLGIPVAFLDHAVQQPWLLPILGIIVGWTTNLLGMQLIFEPPSPKTVLGIKFHGLFPRRQDEAAEVYAQIIADDVVTLENIGDFLLNGPRGDRTRQMLEDALGPAIDQAAGPARAAVRVAVGTRSYDTIRESVAQEAASHTLVPFSDPEFSRKQSERIRTLIAQRCKELPPQDFVEMMRAAIKEDEWMLYLHGAVMGAGGGILHLAIFGGERVLTEEPREDNSVDPKGLAQLAATAAFNTAEWTFNAYLNAGRRLLGVAVHPETAPELVQEMRDVAREAAREVVPQLLPPSEPPDPEGQPHPDADLHELGDALLRRSRDVHHEENAHPAYENILDDLAPDEGRILRLFLLSGPQPSVDVRTGGPLGLLNSELIAPGLNMIGARAGCRYVDRVPQYLNNLFRLGLIWFSRETLRDPLQYQVVEAQPEVLEAAHSVRYPKIVRRSIHLTPFGEDFCKVCLRLDRTVDVAALPEHGTTEDLEKKASPDSRPRA